MVLQAIAVKLLLEAVAQVAQELPLILVEMAVEMAVSVSKTTGVQVLINGTAAVEAAVTVINQMVKMVKAVMVAVVVLKPTKQALLPMVETAEAVS